MTQKTYTFIIGTTDDFDHLESLIDYVDQEGRDGHLNYSCYEFDVDEIVSEDIVTLIGRGLAFENDWSADGTLSFLVHGSLETESESDAVQTGIDAREAQKESQRSDQQTVDPYDITWPSNDPRGW